MPLISPDPDAPQVSVEAVRRLPAGVYRRMIVGTTQLYVRMGDIDSFWIRGRSFPAGQQQPFATQVAILLGLPVQEVMVSTGKTGLWSDDVVLCLPIKGHEIARVNVLLSASGVGERPTETACTPLLHLSRPTPGAAASTSVSPPPRRDRSRSPRLRI